MPVKHLQKYYCKQQAHLQLPPEIPKPSWNITESKLFLAECMIWDKCSRNFVLTDVALLYAYSLLYWRDREGLEIWGLRDGGKNRCWVQLHQCHHRIKVFQPNFTYLSMYTPQIQLQHLILAPICDL